MPEVLTYEKDHFNTESSTIKEGWQVCMNVLGSLPSFPYHATSSAGAAIESGLK